MRDTPAIPQLYKDVTATCMHCISHGAPALDLFLTVDARGGRIADPLGRDLGGLSDDQTGTGALRVIECIHGLRDIAGHGGPVAGQRGHDHPVGQCQSVQADWRE